MGKYSVEFFVAVITSFVLLSNVIAVGNENEKANSYFTAIDDNNNRIFVTANSLTLGDRFISANNIEYRVQRIAGNKVYCKTVGKTSEVNRTKQGLPSYLLSGTQNVKHSIAVYQTHGDESYIPTDGLDSIPGNGGIIKVGGSLSTGFRGVGFKVNHSLNSHYPHDGMAYERSRRTAIKLLKSRPYAIFDVHRDAAPPNEYAVTIKNQEYTKVLIVIGNQHPGYLSNLAFAKELKAAIDRQYPGLVKGILTKDGKYNQDLSPHAILLEYGAQTNSRYAAEHSATAFADATNSLIQSLGPGKFTTSSENAANFISLLFWVLLGGGTAIVLLLINGIRIKEIGKWLTQEFASAIGIGRRKQR